MSQTSILINGATSLKDPAGNIWGINGSEQITVNGRVAVGTSGVVLLAVIGKVVWQQNTAQNWYHCAPSRMISNGNVNWDGPVRAAPLAGVISAAPTHSPPPPTSGEFSSAFSSSFD